MAGKEKVCFVVSPIGQPGSEVRQKADDFLEYIVHGCDAISKHGYKVIRADQINEPGRITTQVVRYIESAALVIVDVTGGNANVYYELSLRDALGKPLITCAELGTVLPFDTRDQRTIFYSMHSRQAQRARTELGNQIDMVSSGEFAPANPIFEALKVIKLTESTDSSERTLGRILEMMDVLIARVSFIEQKLIQGARIGTLSPSIFSDLNLAGGTLSSNATSGSSSSMVSGTLSSGHVYHPGMAVQGALNAASLSPNDLSQPVELPTSVTKGQKRGT
jgi:hypothetical protein